MVERGDPVQRDLHLEQAVQFAQERWGARCTEDAVDAHPALYVAKHGERNAWIGLYEAASSHL